MVGNYTSSGDVSWTATSDGSGGADVVDPPLTSSSTVLSMNSSATVNDVNGTVTFADTDSSNIQTASFTPDGSGYVGTFSLNAVTESNDSASVGFEFSLGNDQINLAPGQISTQSYSVSVTDPQNSAVNLNQTVSASIGGPGNDNFVFHPGVGADTIANFNPQQDTIELDNFANVHSVQELEALITTDPHGCLLYTSRCV